MKMLILLMVCLFSSQVSPPVSEKGLKPVPDTVGSVGAPVAAVAVDRCAELDALISQYQADIAAQQLVVASSLAARDAAQTAYNIAHANYTVAVMQGDPHEALGVILGQAGLALVAAQAAYDADSATLAALIDQLEAYIDEWNMLECEGEISPP